MPKWKFVLTKYSDPSYRIYLATEFELDNTEPNPEEKGLCSTWSSDCANSEALDHLGYTVNIEKEEE